VKVPVLKTSTASIFYCFFFWDRPLDIWLAQKRYHTVLQIQIGDLDAQSISSAMLEITVAGGLVLEAGLQPRGRLGSCRRV
jgi:hypothetical protein